jgi:hypothetical protein
MKLNLLGHSFKQSTDDLLHAVASDTRSIILFDS